MKRKYFLFIYIILLSLSKCYISYSADFFAQDDTIKAINVTGSDIPFIDGMYFFDDAWEDVQWQTIDQFWIPWQEDLDSLDFFGRFKVMWSSETNLLYFLVSTTDDIFIDGYEPENSNYASFDVVELFIDEDRSGGDHIYDERETNAENAFAYHIVTYEPSDNDYSEYCYVADIAENGTIRDYAGHFPEFIMFREGSTYTWEFSLKVYDDAYEHNYPEASRVTLSEGQIIGLSLAYCENDQNDGVRDNFIGSVEVTKERNNHHWQEADDFGVLELINQPISTFDSNILFNELNIFNTNNFLYLEFSDIEISSVSVRIYNILGGPVINEQRIISSDTEEIDLGSLKDGVYFVEIICNERTFKKKIIVR